MLLPIGDIPAAVVAGIVFLGVGFAVGMVPEELRSLLGAEGLLRRGSRDGITLNSLAAVRRAPWCFAPWGAPIRCPS